MIIIHHTDEFLQGLDGFRSRELVNGVDLGGHGTDTSSRDVVSQEIHFVGPEGTLVESYH